MRTSGPMFVLEVRVQYTTNMYTTRLIWISHVMNTTDMGFARDKHDWYKYHVKRALVFANAIIMHMFVLEVRVQYTRVRNMQCNWMIYPKLKLGLGRLKYTCIMTCSSPSNTDRLYAVLQANNSDSTSTQTECKRTQFENSHQKLHVEWVSSLLSSDY